MVIGIALALISLGAGFFVWIVRPESLGYAGTFYVLLGSLFLFFVGIALLVCQVFGIFNRKKRSDDLFFAVIEHKNPWVQATMNMQDYRTEAFTPGILYTYRIAVGNRGDRVIRGVEVNLTSIQPQPAGFHSIGGHLMFRHEKPTVAEKDIPPTKQSDYLDAIFVDAFCYFMNNTGSGNWLESRTTVPGQASMRDLPLTQNYVAIITASSRHGDQVSGTFELIMRQQGTPILRLVR